MMKKQGHRIAAFLAIAFILLLALGAIASGCVARTAVVSSEGRAYVVKGNIFTTKMLYCNAVNGKPTCRPVTEKKN